jgi:hypothetical protein
MQPGQIQGQMQQVMMKGRAVYLEMFTPNKDGEVKVSFGEGLEAVVTILLDIRDILISVNNNGQMQSGLMTKMIEMQATQGIDLTKLRG